MCIFTAVWKATPELPVWFGCAMLCAQSRSPHLKHISMHEDRWVYRRHRLRVCESILEEITRNARWTASGMKRQTVVSSAGIIKLYCVSAHAYGRSSLINIWNWTHNDDDWCAHKRPNRTCDSSSAIQCISYSSSHAWNFKWSHMGHNLQHA